MNKWLLIWLIFVAGWYLIPWWHKVYFLWDDIELLMQLRHPALETFFISHQYQFFPIFLFFYSLETNIFGVNPSAFLTVSVGLHLINIYLVYILINKLTKNNLLSFLASMLVSFNKSYFTVIFWPTIQSNVLLTTWLLLALLLFFELKHKLSLNKLLKFFALVLLAGLSFGFGIGAGFIFSMAAWLFWEKNSSRTAVTAVGLTTGVASILNILLLSTAEIQKDQIFQLSPTRIFNIIYFTSVGVSQAIINRFFLPGFIPNIYSPPNIAVMIGLPAIILAFFLKITFAAKTKLQSLAPLFLFASFTVIPYFIASLARSGPGALGGIAERYVYLPFFAFILALVYGLWLAGITKKTFPKFLKPILIGYIPIVVVGQIVAMSFEVNNLFLP